MCSSDLYAFHDVIYAVAALPRVEQVAKSARRTFIGERVWGARVEFDELFAKNDAQHKAIREAIAARSVEGARLLAREHVLASGRLMETVIDIVSGRAPEGAPWLGEPWSSVQDEALSPRGALEVATRRPRSHR